MFSVKIFSMVCIAVALSASAWGQSSDTNSPLLGQNEASSEGAEAQLREYSKDYLAFRSNLNILMVDTSVPSVMEFKNNKVSEIKGNKQTRAEMILSASKTIRLTGVKDGDTASADLYLNCVSRAMSSESGHKGTIFSSDNLVKTYIKLEHTAYASGNIRVGVQNICDRLSEYYDLMRSPESNSGKNSKEIPAQKWHSIQANFYHNRFPQENVEANIAGGEKKYCIFSSACSSEASLVLPALPSTTGSGTSTR